MRKITIDKWKWRVEDAALLNGWFDHWQSLAVNAAVKQNPVRTVFKVDDSFYVKLERPAGFWRKLCNFLSPKAAREFITARALETANVSVVKHLGWASNGAASMLLTEAMPDSCSVQEYWHREIVYGNVSPKNFLENFAQFLKQFFVSGFYHPDFHTGNILYSPSNKRFALVDVYGISRPEKLSPRQLAELSGIFIELSRALSVSEATAFITRVRNELSPGQARQLWLDGLRQSGEKARKNWSKRQKQIEENYSKFIEVFTVGENEFLVRKLPGPAITVKLEDIPNRLNGNYFDIMRLTRAEAADLWLESFRLELLGINILRPLVFEKPNILYFEKVPDGSRKAEGEKAQEFITQAELKGEEIDPGKLLQFPNGRIVSLIFE